MKSIRESISPGLVMTLGLLVIGGLIVYSWIDGGTVDPPSTFSATGWQPAEDREPIDVSATLKDLEGREVRIDDLDDKVLFINLWATWCGPCRIEMPSMADLHHEFSSSGLQIVAISDEDPETVRQYLEQNPYPFRILIDEEGTLLRRLGIAGIPASLILDQQRRVAFAHTGAMDWYNPRIRDRFYRLLNE